MPEQRKKIRTFLKRRLETLQIQQLPRNLKVELFGLSKRSDRDMEKLCGKQHLSFEEAVTHTYMSLVDGDKDQLSEPFWGTRGGNIANIGKVIGWKSAD